MKTNFESLAALMDRFSGAKTTEDRWQSARIAVRDAGLSAVNVGSARSDTLELTYMRSAMHESWLTEYVERGFANVDRFIGMAAKGGRGDFFDARRRVTDKPLERELFNRLEEEGYRIGFGEPFDSDRCGERRVVTLFSDDAQPREWGAERIAELKCMAMVFNAYLFDGADQAGEFPLRAPLLSGRERDVLLLLASGMQNKHIADRLGIADVTVRAHFTTARRKLGARTREQALAIAMRDRHIAF